MNDNEVKINEIEINGINVSTDTDFSEKKLENIVKYALEQKQYDEAEIEKIVISQENNVIDIDIKYVQNKPKFERIRRITGYLTGDLSTWNQGKLAEVHDRYAHVHIKE